MLEFLNPFSKKTKLPAEKIALLEQESAEQPQTTTLERPTPTKRLPKFRRTPEKLPRREITRIDFDIIKLLHDFKFLSSIQIWKLVAADRKAVYKHLQTLYHQQLINRFHFPTMFGAGEFYYYLDNTQALDLLTSEAGHQKADFHYEEVRRNKQKGYGDMLFDGDENHHQEGKLLFLRHSTMIARFHVGLSLACRASNGRVELKTWKEGTELYNYVHAPAYSFTKHTQEGAVKIHYEEHERKQERIPVRPDAFFTLTFPKDPEKKEASFIYEAERSRNDSKTLNKKLRGHFHAFARQNLHKQDPYNVTSIRAVLVETTSYDWAEHIYKEAHNKVVSPNKSKLFWFTCLEKLTKPEKIEKGTATTKRYPYLEDPKKFFAKLWLPVGQEQTYSLLD